MITPPAISNSTKSNQKYLSNKLIILINKESTPYDERMKSDEEKNLLSS